MQWLEAVNHVVQQMPNAFEFTEDFLVFVADALYSCLFGNFLGNTDRERKDPAGLDVRNKTASVWAYALHRRGRFVNPGFAPFLGPLWPSAALRDVGLWRRYYLRHHPDAHPHALSGGAWTDDHGRPAPAADAAGEVDALGR